MNIQLSRNKTLQFNRGLTDFIKFLSCLMIALHHFSQIRSVEGASNVVYFLFATQGGYLGVAIFFFLSGYGLMKSEQAKHLSVPSFFKKRLMKTYLPAVLVSALWAGYNVIGEGKYDISLLKGILWLFNDEVLWFVRTIIWLYVFFAIYNIIIKYRLLALSLISIIAVWWTNLSLVHGGSVFMFFVGVNIAEHGDAWWQLARKRYVWGVCLIGVIAVCAMFHTNMFVIHLMFDVVFILAFIFFSAFHNIEINNYPHWLSACSYDIYLVHNKALMILRPLYTVLPLLQFLSLTILFTIIFYNLRKFLKI